MFQSALKLKPPILGAPSPHNPVKRHSVAPAQLEHGTTTITELGVGPHDVLTQVMVTFGLNVDASLYHRTRSPSTPWPILPNS